MRSYSRIADTSCKGSVRTEPGQLKSLGTDAFIAFIIHWGFLAPMGLDRYAIRV